MEVDSHKLSIEEPMQLTGWHIKPTRFSSTLLQNCTLIVPTYRRPQSIISLLERLIVLDDTPSEVIVVDGSPESDVVDQFLSWVKQKELPFDIKYIRSPSGLTRQRNIGIEASCGDIIYFLDDDCLPETDYFKGIFKVFQQDINGKIGGVAGSIVNEMGQPLSLRWRLRMWLKLVSKDGVPGKYYANASSVPKSLMNPFIGNISTDILPGGASAFRREVFKEDRFSEFFAGYAQGEDLEMSLRIKIRWQLLWCGDAHVLHLHAPIGRPRPFDKGKMEIRNRYFIWKRHSHSPMFTDQIKFWADLFFIGALDLGRFIARPSQIYLFVHCLGVLSGIFLCVFFPPSYDEPIVKQNYLFQLEALHSEL